MDLWTFQMRAGEVVMLAVNNTVKAKLYIIYPEEDILMVYEGYPSDRPQPIMINPETAMLAIKLRMVSKTPDWRQLNHKYTSEVQKNFSTTKIIA